MAHPTRYPGSLAAYSCHQPCARYWSAYELSKRDTPGFHNRKPHVSHLANGKIMFRLDFNQTHSLLNHTEVWKHEFNIKGSKCSLNIWVTCVTPLFAFITPSHNESNCFKLSINHWYFNTNAKLDYLFIHFTHTRTNFSFKSYLNYFENYAIHVMSQIGVTPNRVFFITFPYIFWNVYTMAKWYEILSHKMCSVQTRI